ncbi:hypothetical protein P20495_1184 [Pseudoalteromonas sp. BSi20495]|nr:hypothetical protein P20495_1184 [Pseudoalteromonas sp. BSi20495]
MRYNAHVFNKIGISQPLKQKSRAICTAFLNYDDAFWWI